MILEFIFHNLAIGMAEKILKGSTSRSNISHLIENSISDLITLCISLV